MKPIRIGFFFEDLAHEKFICSLVQRVIRKKYGTDVEITILNAKGGSKIIVEFERYMNGWKKQKNKGLEFDRIIIVHDGDCKGKETVKKYFVEPVKQSGYPEQTISFAIPDPYIQRWFLLDPSAFKRAMKLTKTPPKLKYVHDKDKPDYYKNQINNIIYQNSSEVALNSDEYGTDIAEAIDLDLLCREDKNFREFVESL